MTIALGLIIILGCILGGFTAMGGHLAVLVQPWEYVIILGSALGIFLVGNPSKLVKDTGKAIKEALTDDSPKQADYLGTLSLLYSLMREMRSKSRAEIESHIDNPFQSSLFTKYPKILKNSDLILFISDYSRLIINGSARSFEIEALMDEEIETNLYESLKPYHSLQSIADGLPALGIVAAVLGVIKAMGALNESPEILGHLIGAALVGTFAGIFFSYSIFSPIASKIKNIRTKKNRLYVVVKQTLLAYMNGSVPQIALEYGRKTIALSDRPTIDLVEQKAISGQA